MPNAPQPTAIKPLPLFSPQGNCARCGFNQNNQGDWSTDANVSHQSGRCALRGNDLDDPAHTFCKNFESRSRERFGAVYAILAALGNTPVPWLDLAVPHLAPAHCCICGNSAAEGIVTNLPDNVTVECCGPAHYMEWWTDYQQRRLEHFKLLAEHAYSAMYDVVFSGATAHYSDAKEALYSAISVATDLELADEKQRIESRLDHIKQVFRSQFK